MQKEKPKENKKYSQKAIKDRILITCPPGNGARKRGLLKVYMCIQFRLDLQADKSSVVAKGPFSPQV
jgi:hypothetical protein